MTQHDLTPFLSAPRAPRRARLGVVAVAATLALGLAACGGGSASDGGGGSKAEITMWVRSSTDDFSTRLVEAYNADHTPKVKLTIIPDDSYQQKVGAAAGSKALPDVLASDVVYSSNYVKQGLYADITDKVEGLSFYDSLVKAHTRAATRDKKIYAVPYKVDSSLIVYNKKLFSQAGLDPEKPPTTFDELYADAKAVRGIGGDTYGFYFGGNCPGCFAYTGFPFGVAAGTPPFDPQGKKADVDSKALGETFALYRKMTEEGIAPASVKTEDGSTWGTSFTAGKVGILPIGSFLFGELNAAKDLDWGVTPIMAPDGSGTSTFVGGDVLGVTSTSKSGDEAWKFVDWTLGKKAQVDVIAKNGDLPGRTDLAGNQYSGADPRIEATIKNLSKGYTPLVLPYGDLVNSPNGPWLAGVRGQIFGDDPAGAAKTMQEKIQAGLDTANAG